MSEIKRRCLSAIADLPRWVETRDLLLSDRSRVFAPSREDAFMVWSEIDRLGAVVGAPEAEMLARVASAVPQLLAFDENIDEVRRVVPHFRAERATVFSSPSELPLTPPHACGVLDAASIVMQAHIPDVIKHELLEVAADGALIVGAYDEERAVAFAYVASQSESLWDVSIDTLESHRRLGYASAAILSLMKRMESQDKLPVWGALESNHASAGLARRLGFVECDALWVLTRDER